ncbi:hypothetical protein AVEN_27220-1 [Araneus ventricosus]|uniref:Uncharacterized protein n=1 Tax=Araneus ventricosus TaxID=182803 RepID=A0A4Y2CBD8_ARAVE|nr:hypothetical protein AVEN_27220-1 [Araneus ventricosus]
MLADERRHIRELDVRSIIKARGSSSTVQRRLFVVPKLNFKANQYIDMIDWFKCDVTEPPLTDRNQENQSLPPLHRISKDTMKVVAFHCQPNE